MVCVYVLNIHIVYIFTSVSAYLYKQYLFDLKRSIKISKKRQDKVLDCTNKKCSDKFLRNIRVFFCRVKIHTKRERERDFEALISESEAFLNRFSRDLIKVFQKF